MTDKSSKSIVTVIAAVLMSLTAAVCLIPNAGAVKADEATDFSSYFAAAPYDTIYTNEATLSAYKESSGTPEFIRQFINTGEINEQYCTKLGELVFSLSGGGGSVTAAVYSEANAASDDICLIEFPEAAGKIYTQVRLFTEPYQTYAVPFGTQGRHYVIPRAVYDLNSTVSLSTARLCAQTETATAGYQYQLVYKGRTVYAQYGTVVNPGITVKNITQLGMAGGGEIQGYYIPYLNEYVTASEISGYQLKDETVLHIVTNLYDPRGEIALTTPAPPEGKVFAGWYYDDVTFNRPYHGEAITGDTNLYARFVFETVTIVFDTDGGNAIETLTVDWGTEFSELNITPPEKTGYTFSGWKAYNSSFTTEFGDINDDFVIDTNIGLKAQWTVNQYTATFKPDNGGESVIITVTYNETVELPVSPEKTGYNFKGWYDGSGRQYTGTAYTYASDMTFTAKWEIKTYTVTFYVDGEVYKTVTVEHGTSLMDAAEKNSVQATGYKLSGGVYSENLEGVKVTEDMTVEGTVTNWTRIKDYAVKYKSVVITAACVIIAVITLIVLTSKKGYRRRR